MTKSRFITVLVGWAVLLISCQVPWEAKQATSGVRLTLSVTAPSVGPLPGNARLLLDNADSVVLTITDEEGEVQTKSASLTSNTVQFVLSLELGNTYTIVASAQKADGTELFRGTTTPIYISAASSVVLNLIPVQGLEGTVRAVDQVGSGDLQGEADIPGLGPQEVATFWGDFGATGSEFVFADPAPLELYIQDVNGAPITLAGLTLPLSSLGGSTEFRATFYNPGAGTTSEVSGFGSFKIPVQSFAVVGPASIDVGETVAFTTGSPLPANATELTVGFSTASLAFTVSGSTVTGVASGLGTLEALDVNGAQVNHTLSVVERVVYSDQGAPWSLQPWGVPIKTIALAGTPTRLWALTGVAGLHEFANGVWTNTIPNAPTGALWLAADGDEVLTATETEVSRFDGSTWSTLTAAPTGVTILGLAVVEGTLWIAGDDGVLWSWDGVWTQGPALPAGFARLGGSSELLALTATQVLSFDGSSWNSGPTLVDSTVSVGQAFGVKYSLVVR